MLAYALGLSGLGLVNIKIMKPWFVLPEFIQKHGHYYKALLIGLLLANFDLWCPNPVFYVLLEYAGTENVFTGWSAIAVYGAGKATSMMFPVILGILGIAASNIKERIGSVKMAPDWGLLFVGAFLLIFGGFYHNWYDETEFHETWNDIVITLSDGKIGEVEYIMPENALHEIPQWPAPYVFVILLAIPAILHFYKNKKDKSDMK